MEEPEKDKIKRQVMNQELSEEGVSFINFRTVVKSLRLNWIGRLLDDTNGNWKAISSHYLNKYGGLAFLLKCNYDVKFLDSNIPPFYRELLGFFQELSSKCEREKGRKFII